MSNVENAVVEIRPFGDGGAELGMSRAEMLDQINFLRESLATAIGDSIEILFAWLVVMFFIAHRLSRAQFFTAVSFYLIGHIYLYGTMYRHVMLQSVWARYGGFISRADAGGGTTPIDSLLSFLMSGYTSTFVYWAIVATSIWWAVSCRRNQPKDIGSPL